MTNLAHILANTARRQPDAPAQRLGDAVLTYAGLDEAAAKVAAQLRAEGLQSGERVCVMLPNILPFAPLYYGILRAGGVVVPMNPLLKAREVEHYLTDSGAVRLFVFAGVAEEAGKAAAAAGVPCTVVDPAAFLTGLTAQPQPEIAPREDNDPAVILYTSGTTGRPKGAVLTHANLRSNITTVASSLFDLRPSDVVMGCLPLFHTFGQACALNAAVYRGSCLVLVPRFEPAAVLDAIERFGVTVFEGVPTMYGALLQHPRAAEIDASALRVCVSGGAALPVEVLHGFEKAFGCAILEGYGLSETSPVVTFNHPDRPRKAGSIGTPIDGVRVRLLDADGAEVAPGEIGEIAVQGPNVMRGYWNLPEATAEAIPDGWLRTGDLARQDEDGYYFIVDRKKDLIIRGGYNVYPREIEEVLYELPAVAEAAVIGVPHPTHGEEVAAAVALKAGATATADELRDYVKERVAAYKYPRQVWLVPELPKGPTGKILKRQIGAILPERPKDPSAVPTEV
ncbi:MULTISPECIES: long-chain-fatty-acid--CoA ligase [Amycolatopsis]|uniref:long-chain-fatty-acid--CoA ligase n=1 Tax=Amycolatopsis TaxID=1813 RepID=UPI000B8A8D83|nr:MULTISPECIES: long-chain fatty acid--CoA ligase [Amycolatopsis]OXM66147.1 long-chain-fatty-acid--CoA ligase [Amycolatopsis sp. KNN50.9b]